MGDATVFHQLSEEQLRRRNTIKWNFFGPDVLPLWIAEMDYPTAPAVLDGIRACVANEEFGYPPVGEVDLPEATAEWCRRRYGWRVSPDRVRVVPDVLKGLEVVISFLTRPESPVVLPIPAYMPFFDVLQVTGRQRVEIAMLQQDSGRYVMDLEALDAAFTGGAGSLILCNPNNPLGTAFREEELRAIVDIAARHDARVIADEIHGPLVYGRPHVVAASVSDTAADTVVTLDGRIIGKPHSTDDARRVLERLSGQTHSVITGVTIIRLPDAERRCFVESTQVQFASISSEEITRYLATEEPYDKAGSYAIQGRAGRYIPRIEGCYFNVVGLPLSRVIQALAELGWSED